MSIGASLQSLFQGKREKALGVSERLMLRYSAKGDEASLAALFDLHSHKLFYFLKVLSDSTVAEDICQRTWIKVIENRHLFKSGDNFQAWLFTIGRRTLIDEFRKKYEESDAIIEIAVRLFFGGKVFYLFKVFPKFIRDFFYQLIARNRYSFFGKRETCRIATSEEKARFLE